MLRNIFTNGGTADSFFCERDTKMHGEEYISPTQVDSFHEHLIYLLLDKQLVC